MTDDRFSKSNVFTSVEQLEIVDAKEFFDAAYSDDLQMCLFEYYPTHVGSELIRATEEMKAMMLLKKYNEFADVFSKQNAEKLPEHGKADHAIELEKGKNPPFGPIYNLSVTKLEVLREYLKDNLKKGFITPSSSPAGAPILFVPKPGGGLRLCVDYRGLNFIIKKNRYPLSLINSLLDRLVGAKVYTKLDIRSAYNALRIKKGDEGKTAFRCRYEHYEYRVMSFGLANASASFMSYIHDALREYLDIFVVVYVDDILIFSANQRKHDENVLRVLRRLRQYGLFVKLDKCEFDVREVSFLRYIVGVNGIRMNPDRIKTIVEWPMSRTHRDVQVFLSFANFYRRFVDGFNRITAGLSDLLKESQKRKFLIKFVLTDEAVQFFETLKQLFINAPMLRHFDPVRKILVETDASGRAVSGVLFQLNEETGQWHPVAFMSRKMSPAEMNYGAEEGEMLVIVEACKQGRHYVEGAQHQIRVLIDHHNLRGFFKNKALSRREARGGERLSGLNLLIEYRLGKKNLANDPSKRPDYMDVEESALIHTMNLMVIYDRKHLQSVESAQRNTLTLTEEESRQLLHLPRAPDWENAQALSSSAGHNINESIAFGASVEPFRDLGEESIESQMSTFSTFQRLLEVRIPEARLAAKSPNLVTPQGIRRAAESDIHFGEMSFSLRIIVNILQKTDHLAQKRWPFATSLATERRRMKFTLTGMPLEEDKKWHVSDNILHYERKMYILSRELRGVILRLHHDDSQAGHFGYEKTLELIKRKYHGPKMTIDVKEYVNNCSNCAKIKALRHKPYELLQSLLTPQKPRQDWTMDFIIDLSSSKLNGLMFDFILVVVDRYIKYARYIPFKKDWDVEQLIDAMFDGVFTKFGLPKSIVSDRGSLFTTHYGSDLCYYLQMKLKYSTAFHPQTNGQTKRQNQILEQYLRCYINYQQDDWARWLNLTEYAYNNSCHSVIKLSPFQVLFGEEPQGEDPIDEEREKIVPTIKARAEKALRLQKKLTSKLRKATETQAKYYDQKHISKTYFVGDKVLLSSKNITSNRSIKKLNNKYYDSFEIEKPIGKQSYKLKLPKTFKSIHNVFHVSLLEPYRNKKDMAPESIMIRDEERWPIEQILNSKIHYNKLKYLIRGEGCTEVDDTYLSVSEFKGAKSLIRDFITRYSNKLNKGVKEMLNANTSSDESENGGKSYKSLSIIIHELQLGLLHKGEKETSFLGLIKSII